MVAHMALKGKLVSMGLVGMEEVQLYYISEFLSPWIGWKERVAKLCIYPILFILQIKTLQPRDLGTFDNGC